MGTVNSVVIALLVFSGLCSEVHTFEAFKGRKLSAQRSLRAHFGAQDAAHLYSRRDSRGVGRERGMALRAVGGLGAATTFAKTVFVFSRPHTLVGSGVSVLALFLSATPMELWKTPLFWSSLNSALVPSLLMNLYITGLNQLTDVEIDKINKPYLPVASGDLSRSHGVIIVVLSLLGSLLLSLKAVWPLQFVLWGSCFLGTIYSLPPFRLKRFPALAAFCILVVRGSLINLGFYLQAKQQLVQGAGAVVAQGLLHSCAAYPQAVALSAFFAVFGVVIAIMKDVPDIKGDKVFGIKSLSVRLGAKTMFGAGWKLLVALLGGTATGIFSSLTRTTGAPLMFRTSLGVALGAMALDVRRRALVVDPEIPTDVFKYYMHLWNVFYASYVLLPITSLCGF